MSKKRFAIKIVSAVFGVGAIIFGLLEAVVDAKEEYLDSDDDEEEDEDDE